MHQKIILRQRIIIRVKSFPQGFFSLSTNKEVLAGGVWSKNYSTKKSAQNQGEEKLFLEEDAFFIKDKKGLSAKFLVNILRQYVMYVMFYHYTDNLWNSATFASFRNFRNCQLRESNPCHCGANNFELTKHDIQLCHFDKLFKHHP